MNAQQPTAVLMDRDDDRGLLNSVTSLRDVGLVPRIGAYLGPDTACIMAADDYVASITRMEDGRSHL